MSVHGIVSFNQFLFDITNSVATQYIGENYFMCDLFYVFAKKMDSFQIRILQHNIYLQEQNLIKA